MPRERPAGQPLADDDPDAAGGEEHPLLGDWTFLWLSHSRTHTLTIERTVPMHGVTDIVGRIEGDHTGVCPVSGYILDEFVGEIRDGFDVRTIGIAALVRLRIRCPTEEIVVEALGLPSRSIAMAGRATIITQDGSRIVEAVAIGRPAEAPEEEAPD